MKQVHRLSTRALALVLVALGIAAVISTVARGGGPFSVGVVMGIVLALFGAARLYLSGVMHDQR